MREPVQVRVSGAGRIVRVVQRQIKSVANGSFDVTIAAPN
jgi:hypothetical protein